MKITDKNVKRLIFVCKELEKKKLSDEYIAWQLKTLMRNNFKTNADVSDVTAAIVTGKEFLAI